MRILFVSHSFPPADAPLDNLGGMQRVATELYAALRRVPGVHVEGELLHTSWKATHVRVPFFLARVLRRLKRLGRSGGADVVLFSSMVTAATTVRAGAALRAAGIRSAAIAHGRDLTLPTRTYQKLLPYVFRALDGLLPVSRATGDEALGRGLPHDKLRVLPNGIDVTRFAPPADAQQARADLLRSLGLDLPPGALLLASVGRHVERKGFVWFAEQVMPRTPDGVHWLLGGEGPETERIRAVVAERGLEDRVHLLGRVSEGVLTQLYQGADLFVMPNRPVPGDMEGFGVVMLEAGLAGTPSLGAGIEGIRDVITEGVNGHLVPSGDAQAFGELIGRYHADRTALQAISVQAATHVRDTFSWDAVARRYVDALREMTGLHGDGIAACGGGVMGRPTLAASN
jgi:phosphatidylinositol alpha-1,6-mannosyltransferase